jgi:hypothetical protein
VFLSLLRKFNLIEDLRLDEEKAVVQLCCVAVKKKTAFL